MSKQLNEYCLSSFLSFRYVVDRQQDWTNGWKPWWPLAKSSNQVSVKTENDILSFLKTQFDSLPGKIGILLSGGIDSAILASFLPEGTHAYTIRFDANHAVDESIQANIYTKLLNLKHHIIDVYWEDYLQYSDILMTHKRSPLHAIEVAIYKASLMALNDNIEYLIVGNGADSTFGGMDKLLSKDWLFQDFIERYTFVNPKTVLKKTLDISSIYEPYKLNESINVQAFLKTIHGDGIIQTFCNAAETAGVQLIEPFEALKYVVPLDLDRIRRGESKYILRSIFAKRFPGLSIPDKIPFSRPMNEWLRNWSGPQSDYFLTSLNISNFSGDQKWLIYNLDNFIQLISG